MMKNELTIEKLSDFVYPLVNKGNVEIRPVAVQISNWLYDEYDLCSVLGSIINAIYDFRNGKISYTTLVENIKDEVIEPLPTKMDSDPIPTEMDAPLDGGKIQVGTTWRIDGRDIFIPAKIGDKQQCADMNDPDWLYCNGQILKISDHPDFYTFCLTQGGAGYILSTFEKNGERYFNAPNTKIFYRIKI